MATTITRVPSEYSSLNSKDQTTVPRQNTPLNFTELSTTIQQVVTLNFTEQTTVTLQDVTLNFTEQATVTLQDVTLNFTEQATALTQNSTLNSTELTTLPWQNASLVSTDLTTHPWQNSTSNSTERETLPWQDATLNSITSLNSTVQTTLPWQDVTLNSTEQATFTWQDITLNSTEQATFTGQDVTLNSTELHTASVTSLSSGITTHTPLISETSRMSSFSSTHNILSTTYIITDEQATDATTVPPASSNNIAAAVLGALLGIFIIVCILLIVYIICNRKKRRDNQGNKYSGLSNPAYEFTDMTTANSLVVNGLATLRSQDKLKAESLPQLPMIHADEVCQSTTLLGIGRYGNIYFGRLIRPNIPSIDVAIKTLKDNPAERDVFGFAAQLDLYNSLGQHPNIIRLIGACVSPPDQPMRGIFEYAATGNLRDYLLTQRTLQADKDDAQKHQFFLLRLEFALDVANGMRHLAVKQIVHREIAAKNIVIGDDMICKIVGLNSPQWASCRLSYRWMAPEVITSKQYSSMSDVWSFGVFLWELASLGGRPYGNMTTDEMYTKLKEGSRLERPEDCPTSLYDLMLSCWEFESQNRPTFLSLQSLLGEQKTKWQSQNDYLNGIRAAVISKTKSVSSSSSSSASDNEDATGDNIYPEATTEETLLTPEKKNRNASLSSNISKPKSKEVDSLQPSPQVDKKDMGHSTDSFVLSV